jgi:hypothetical protein
MGEQEKDGPSGRWQRRELRRRSERSRIKKHGAGLRRIYIDSVRKRVAERKAKRRTV